MASSYNYTQHQVEEFSCSWTISNFSFADDENGASLTSSTFSDASGRLKWALQLYPNGVDSVQEGYVSCFAVLVSAPEAGVRACARLVLLNAEGQEAMVIENNYYTRVYEGDQIGSELFSRNDVLDDASGLLQDDKLTLTCKITVEKDPEISTAQVKEPDSSLAFELGELWEESLLTDCTLCVAGQEFKAHKSILAVRCPVFRAMFLQDTKEQQTNRVEIKEMEPDVLKEILTYIYSGKAPNIRQMAAKLLAAADMYLLDRLKSMCEDTLCSSLTVDNAAETLILGDLHQAQHTKNDAVTFINVNAEEVTKTDGWTTLTDDHPHLITDLYQSLVSAGEPPAKRQRRF
ncbi:speckle-type POZ protein-like [Denticeps clupeoides]|uniref:speckle-type POZ protein-like n=1 Tax=Denticeps clupeoides TaxID=299321 RepID=UPI0010A521D0|nr:speckle-type POZ protein-like [Denticeps clupeoides]XP_028847043.1 speckle-type POZ protein-like [Denticeps clupeoides]XP_028847044.1 speckle-type POZ protein-like [Denticeps clupeoides]